VRTLRAAGDAARSAARFHEALEAREEERALHERLGARADAARCRLEVAELNALLRETMRAMDGFRRALSDHEALGDRAGMARALQGLGAAHLDCAEPDQALVCYERSLELWKALGKRIEAARVQSEIGLVRADRGELEPALELQERAREELLAAGDRRSAARVLGNLALTLQNLGRDAASLETLQRAEREFTALSDPLGGTITLVALGRLLKLMGRYGEALDSLEQARKQYEEAGNPGGADTALEGIAEIYHYLGRFDEARELLEGVLARQEARGNREETVLTLYALGATAQKKGELDLALETFQRCRRTARAQGDRLALTKVLTRIGQVHVRRHRLEEAVQSFGLALREAEALGARGEAAWARTELGLAQVKQGRSKEGLVALEAALRESEALGNPGDLARAQHYLARGELLAGRPDRALTLARAGLRNLLVLGRGSGELDAWAIHWDARGLSDLGLEAAEQQLRSRPEPRSREEALEQALHLAEAGRGLHLVETLVNRTALEGARLPAELFEAQTRARAASRARWNQVTDLASRPDADPRALRAARGALDAAHRDLEDVVSRIQRGSRRVAQVLYPEPIRLAELRKALPPKSAFVLYQLAGDRAFALVVGARDAELVDLGDAPALGRELAGWVQVMLARGAEEPELARALYDRLIRPIHGPIEGASRLIVSPDGPLDFFPLEALVRAEGERRARLVEVREVLYVPSGTVWEALRREALERKGEGLLAVGDPVYPGEEGGTPVALARREAVLRGFGKLVRLPGSAREVEAVASLFPPEQRTILLRERATVSGLGGALQATRGRLRAVHLACHGLLDAERPYLSGLALSGGEVLSLDAVYRLRVPADLVVLSACETGKGRLVRGEGVLGLVRGFFFAGAPRVVVSNWKVADEEARAFMTAFYRAMMVGQLPPAAALQSAKRTLIGGKAGPPTHPRDWAAFVLWGLGE